MSEMIDDGGPQIVYVDDAEVALWVRVGPVFNSTIKRGVWVELQEKHMETRLRGPVLLSKEKWEILNTKVMESFDE